MTNEISAKRRVANVAGHLISAGAGRDKEKDDQSANVSPSSVAGALPPVSAPYAESAPVPPESVPWSRRLDQVAVRTKLSRELDERDPGIVRQRQQGKLTCRERIALLVDAGSFREHGSISGATSYDRDDPEKLVRFQRWAGKGRGDKGHGTAFGLTFLPFRLSTTVSNLSINF